jgi:hypothetical protein
MKIGIDISQVAYEKTGVARSVARLVENLIQQDKSNQYVFFFSSLRGKIPNKLFNELIKSSNVQIRTFRIPQSILTRIWNDLHVLPVEWLLGPVDVFISSDWTEPPARKAKKVTFIHDMTPFLYPDQTAKSIVDNHTKKLNLAKKEDSMFICPSEATKKDVVRLLKIPSEKVKVIPWGA